MNTKLPDMHFRLLKGTARKSGLSLDNIAARAGITKQTARMAMLGYQTTPRMRRRIEVALQRPVWSFAAEFEKQNAVAKWLGADPFIVRLRDTILLARGKGIVIRGKPLLHAPVLAQILTAYDAAHPSPAPRRQRSTGKGTSAESPQPAPTQPQP